MMKRWVLCSAILLCSTSIAAGADKPSSKKSAAKHAAKAGPAHRKAAPTRPSKSLGQAARKRPRKTAKAIAKPPAKAVLSTTASAALRARSAAYTPRFTPTAKLTGKRETLTCRDGTEDRHARIGVVLIGGKVDSFAYYSKWKPRTCSIYLERNRDPYSRWQDRGSVTNVSLDHGLFLIEQEKGAYRFVFRDIDRERFCGMDGKINGSLTIRKGTERCEVVGIMEEGVPLGEAYAHLATGETTDVPASAAPAVPSAKPRSRWWPWWWPWRGTAQPATPYPAESESPGD